MSTRKIARLTVVISSTLAAAALIAPIASGAETTAKLNALAPRVITGGAQHLLASSAQLTGLINPNGTPTSYYFQYGPTFAYGSQTPTVAVGNGITKVSVGQSIAGLQQGVIYHFRIVGVYPQGQVVGRDRFFTPKAAPLKFELTKLPQMTVGTPFVLTGSLRGFGAANHQVVLQASPYPYLESFNNIGLPAVTNAAGRFAFRVANLVTSTEFRVITLDSRPLYSPLVTVHAAVRVTLRVRSSGHPGLVRLYGTVTPAAVGAQVYFQVQKAVRPGKSEETTRFVNQFSSTVKKATHAYSRFSMIVTVRHGGRYRAFVKLRTGGLVSGFSTQTVVLHAAPGSAPKAKRK
jgi:hypothetical protein